MVAFLKRQKKQWHKVIYNALNDITDKARSNCRAKTSFHVQPSFLLVDIRTVYDYNTSMMQIKEIIVHLFVKIVPKFKTGVDYGVQNTSNCRKFQGKYII